MPEKDGPPETGQHFDWVASDDTLDIVCDPIWFPPVVVSGELNLKNLYDRPGRIIMVHGPPSKEDECH